MVAYYEVKLGVENPKSRIVKVNNVRDEAHAKELQKRIANVHADGVKLIQLEDYGFEYTANEIMTERNLFGGPRRYSCGSLDGTVTIPEE